MRHTPLYLQQINLGLERGIAHQTVVVVARSYENQFVTSVDHDASVVLAKSQQHVERYAEIEVTVPIGRWIEPSRVP